MRVMAVNRSLRASLALLATVSSVLAASGGCGTSSGDATVEAEASASPSEEVEYVLPAYETGGACQLLDYDTIDSNIGIRFTIAAAAQTEDTYTCILQQTAVSYPDFTLSVSTITADTSAFKSAVVPDGATEVENLGQSAYSSSISAADDAGPGVRVQWVSTGADLVTLRVRLAPEATAEEAEALTAGLVSIGKIVDLMTS